MRKACKHVHNICVACMLFWQDTYRSGLPAIGVDSLLIMSVERFAVSVSVSVCCVQVDIIFCWMYRTTKMLSLLLFCGWLWLKETVGGNSDVSWELVMLASSSHEWRNRCCWCCCSCWWMVYMKYWLRYAAPSSPSTVRHNKIMIFFCRWVKQYYTVFALAGFIITKGYAVSVCRKYVPSFKWFGSYAMSMTMNCTNAK